MKYRVTATVLAVLLLGTAVPVQAQPEPVCGDVNDSGTVNASDALLVLKSGVGQPVTLDCSSYDTRFDSCSSDLTDCLAAPECGDGILGAGEDCESENLDDATCVTLGFAGGDLACAAGCTFDTTDCYADRFDSTGDTILDRKTGLEWEKKTTAIGSGANPSDPHDVDNTYSWGFGGVANGTAFTEFLPALNTGTMSIAEDGTTTWSCYAGHCDWRLPTIAELESIAIPYPTCPAGPCVLDAGFLPTQNYVYWSSSTYLSGPAFAWSVEFSNGYTFPPDKTTVYFVRAVRSGS